MNAELLKPPNTKTTLSRRFVQADEDLARAEIQLRAAIGALFRKIIVRDKEFRTKLAQDHGWTPTTPAIPCEWSRTVGDVREAAYRFFAQGHQSVIVPLLIREEDAIQLVVGNIIPGSDEPETGVLSGGESIANMDPRVTMEVLHKTLSLTGEWDIAELTETDAEQFDL